MKAKLLIALLLILLQPILVEAQNRTVISGSIYDAETKKALPYVNIGFLKESIGTVSDENGEFHLAVDATTIGKNSLVCNIIIRLFPEILRPNWYRWLKIIIWRFFLGVR